MTFSWYETPCTMCGRMTITILASEGVTDTMCFKKLDSGDICGGAFRIWIKGKEDPSDWHEQDEEEGG